MEARIVTDSAGCPEAVELWLIDTPDTMAGIEISLVWSRPDVAHFIREIPNQEPDSARSRVDTALALFQPDSNSATLDCDSGLLADWGLRSAHLRTETVVKIMAVADFMRPEGASPVSKGASGLLFRMPLVVQTAVRGAPPIDSVSLSIHPDQLRVSNKRGELIDVKPIPILHLDVSGCPMLNPQ